MVAGVPSPTTALSEPISRLSSLAAFSKESRIGGKSKSRLTPFVLDQPRRTFCLKFADIQIYRPGMKGAGRHKEAGDMKKRQQIEMDIAGGKAQIIIKMDIGEKNIAMTEQGAARPTGHRRGMDNDKAVGAGHFGRQQRVGVAKQRGKAQGDATIGL